MLSHQGINEWDSLTHLFTLCLEFWKYALLSYIAISNFDNIIRIIIIIMIITALILIALVRKKM